MPPKAKFTKAEIIEAALNIVRADGYEALTSRALGTYLGSSLPKRSLGIARLVQL